LKKEKKEKENPRNGKKPPNMIGNDKFETEKGISKRRIKQELRKVKSILYTAFLEKSKEVS